MCPLRVEDFAEPLDCISQVQDQLAHHKAKMWKVRGAYKMKYFCGQPFINMTNIK